MRRVVITLLALAGLGLFGAAPAFADPNNEPASFAFVLDEPNVSKAPNGDLISVIGSGDFSVHPKSATGSGTFTHTTSTGAVLASGTWTVNDLLSFEFYGCGVVSFADPDIILPADFCGGALKLDVTLVPTGAPIEFEGILTIFCIVGPQTPASHDEPDEEGVSLVVPGVLNFNKIVSGMNIYIMD